MDLWSTWSLRVGMVCDVHAVFVLFCLGTYEKEIILVLYCLGQSCTGASPTTLHVPSPYTL